MSTKDNVAALRQARQDLAEIAERDGHQETGAWADANRKVADAEKKLPWILRG